jgi:phage tail-like protein
MAITQDHPYSNAQFSVEIPAFPQAQAFDEVLIPELLIEVEELREGNDRLRSSRKFPGLSKYTNLILRRGFSGNLDLYQWWKLTSEGDSNVRQNLIIHLLNEEQNIVATWKLSGAFPVRYAFTTLNGLDGDPLIETLEVSCDSVTLE